MLLHDLKAQETFKRAAEIAITGNHGLHLLPLEGAAYQFDPRLMDGRPELRDAWGLYSGQPWSEIAATDELEICNAALRRLEYDAGQRACPRYGMLSVSIAPIGWIDRVLPPPAEPHDKVLARIAESRARLDSVNEWPSHHARELLGKWRDYYPDGDPKPMIAVARTIAAMAGSEDIERVHMAEALSYRRAA
jgi:hypothetical protein